MTFINGSASSVFLQKKPYHFVDWVLVTMQGFYTSLFTNLGWSFDSFCNHIYRCTQGYPHQCHQQSFQEELEGACLTHNLQRRKNSLVSPWQKLGSSHGTGPESHHHGRSEWSLLKHHCLEQFNTIMHYAIQCTKTPWPHYTS